MVTQLQLERPYTASDLAEIDDDRHRYEIIGGELIASPSPSEPHQRTSSRLLRMLATQVEDLELGMAYSAPFDVHLSEHDVVPPKGMARCV